MDANVMVFLLKVFAITFSVMYVVYAIVIFQQTRIMSRTLESVGNSILIVVSALQIIGAFVLLFMAFLI